MAHLGGLNPFYRDSLAQELERHHVTGIAFSAVVGIGLFQTSGEIIAVGGSVGALLAFVLASLIIFSVMRSLAEMVSVRPIEGSLMDLPGVFVNPALGFTVGIMYWFANSCSMIILIVTAAIYTQYWQHGLGVVGATFLLLLAVIFMNACGVRLYGRLEWVFKWLKICLILGICGLAIAIKAGAGKKPIDSNFTIAPGYSSTTYAVPDNSTVAEVPEPMIPGTGGKILAVWTCLTLAMFQFMGGEMVLMTTGEAKMPRYDIPAAARYMFMLPIGLYIIAIFLIGLCVDFKDPMLSHPHTPNVDKHGVPYPTIAQAPIVVAARRAEISVSTGFFNGCFLFSALTAGNSALYASSRTVFYMARMHGSNMIQHLLGRTNRGQTPLAAIIFSFLPGLVAFIGSKYTNSAFKEPIHLLGRLYTGPILCVYAAQCLAFLRFQYAMRYYPNEIIRDSDAYRHRHYRAHWQPIWAVLGLVMCLLLIVFGGWNAVYDLCSSQSNVLRDEVIVDLVFTYPILFVTVYTVYAISIPGSIRLRNPAYGFEGEWTLDAVGDGQARPRHRNRFTEILSLLR